MNDIAEILIALVNRLIDAMTSFSNEIGADNGDALNTLYTEHGLSAAPTDAEFGALSTRDNISYRAAEKVIEDRAIDMNSLYEDVLAIDSGSGAFGTANAVKAWATANMGLVGEDIASNIDVFLALRSKLAPLISSAEMKSHADAVRGFRDELDTQREAGNIKT